MKHVSTYLKRLKFDPKLKNSFIAKYITNLRLIILIVLGISLFGIFSYTSLPRDLYPDVKIPNIIVSTVLPGASPNDVESLVTIPLEDALNSVSDVKTISSNSLESVSTIVVELETGVDLDKAKSEIQSAVDGVTDLPEDAQDPSVMKIDLQKTPIWTFTLTGGDDRASLIRFSERLKQKLEDLKNIDEVQISGIEEQEVQIIIRPSAISTFNINPQILMGAVKSSLNTFPAGNVTTMSSAFALTINPVAVNIDDIRNLKINLNGQIVTLSDIAVVVEKAKPDQYPVYVAEKENKIVSAVTFNIYRVKSVNIGTASTDAEHLIEEEIKSENGKFKLYNIANYAEQITEQFNHLARDLVITIILVAVILFLFLGARQAFVALLATPLTFLISFIVMQLTGISLNFISVFALILSLGLLVDDTIVVVSAITSYYRSGKFAPLETGLLVWRDFIIAIFTTTVTTIWAFLPILVSKGIIGEFIKPIPIVVSTTLAGSFFVAMFITMPFILFLLKPNTPKRVIVFGKIITGILLIAGMYFVLPKNGLVFFQFLVLLILVFITFKIRENIIQKLQSKFKIKITKESRQKIGEYLDTGILSFQRIEYYYSRFILKVLNSQSARRKIITMVVIFSIFSFLLVPFGFVKNEFFPKSNSETMSITIELPAGTSLAKSKEEALMILDQLKKTPETKYVLLTLGGGGGFFGGGSSGQNIISYTLVFTDKHERSLTSSDIAELLRKEYEDYTTGKFLVSEESGGPPAGSDIQIKLFGSDLNTLGNYAAKIEEFLKKEPGATNIDRSIKSGTSKIVFIPDEDRLAASGISQDSVGFWLRLFATGIQVDSIKLDKDINTATDITLRMDSSSVNVDDISSINIPTQNGAVPITSLGRLELQPNPTLITRENGKRTISVTAGVKKGYTAPSINSKLTAFADSNLGLTTGYTWATGGVNEENQNSMNSIFTAMIISVFLIIITMVLQFNSFRKAMIVILVIPLSISGVFIMFGLTQTALSFPALIGVLALFGIVVKNSILVMDKIVANIDSGMEYAESIADAAASRLEPIALTSITAIVGLIPITLSDPLWRGLGGAIIAGLTFSGTIMLFFIPVVYYIVFKPKTKPTSSQKSPRRV